MSSSCSDNTVHEKRYWEWNFFYHIRISHTEAKKSTRWLGFGVFFFQVLGLLFFLLVYMCLLLIVCELYSQCLKTGPEKQVFCQIIHKTTDFILTELYLKYYYPKCLPWLQRLKVLSLSGNCVLIRVDFFYITEDLMFCSPIFLKYVVCLANCGLHFTTVCRTTWNNFPLASWMLSVWYPHF